MATEHYQRNTPDEFERYVADLWERQGYVTEQTQDSHDYGVDVFAHPSNRDKLEVIQVKRNKPGNKVGGPTVQQTIGAKEQYDAHKAVIVTTSSFTSNAETVADMSGVELIDGDELERLDRKYIASPTNIGTQNWLGLPENQRRIVVWIIILYWVVIGLVIVYQRVMI